MVRSQRHPQCKAPSTPEKFENTIITGHRGFMFVENSSKEIILLSWNHRFPKAPFSKCFPSTLKRKAGVVKFLPFEKCFLKALLSVRISVDGLTVVWSLHKTKIKQFGLIWLNSSSYIQKMKYLNKNCDRSTLIYFHDLKFNLTSIIIQHYITSLTQLIPQ